MREFSTIQEKILDRALYLIGKKGSFDVPVRDITREAGANVNAVNYYFGCKENLIEKVQEFFIDNYLSAYSVLDTEADGAEKLLNWANEVMEYTLQYPGIQVLLRDVMKSPIEGKMKQFLTGNAYPMNDKVLLVMRDVFGVEGEMLELVQNVFFSAVLYPASFGTGFDYDTTKIKEKEYRLRYIASVIRILKKGTKRNEI